jgi:toxin-antitoxin system PIN domain toxin
LIAIDTNILVYAHRADAPFHAVARRVMKAVVEGDRVWAIPWPCVHEFLAKVTHARIFKVPTPSDLALAQIHEWHRSPSATFIGEVDGYLDCLAGVVRESKVTGAKVHDARIAAICRVNGVEELWSADRDFSRFSGLRLLNPLA